MEFIAIHFGERTHVGDANLTRGSSQTVNPSKRPNELATRFDRNEIFADGNEREMTSLPFDILKRVCVCVRGKEGH